MKLLSISVSIIVSFYSSPVFKRLLEGADAKNIQEFQYVIAAAVAIICLVALNGATNLYFEIKKGEAADQQFDALEAHAIELKALLQRDKGVVYAGPAEQAFDQITAKLEGASGVKNTLVGVSSVGEYQRRAEEVYSSFFSTNPNAIWRDLVGASELYGSRFKMNIDPANVEDRHRVNVLKHSVPLINSLIIYYGNEASCVFFGWSAMQNANETHIFFSEDKRIVGLFDKYFEMLWGEKTIDTKETSVSYSNSGDRLKGLDIVDKVGRWLTLGYYPSDTGDLEVDSYGILDVVLASEGRLEISGDIFEPDLKLKNPIDSERVYQTINQLAFEYRFDFAPRQRLGFGVYRFRKNRLTRTAGGNRADLLDGFYVNSLNRIRKDVIGVKLPPELSALDTFSALEKGLAEYKADLEAIAKRSLLKPIDRLPSSKPIALASSQ